MIYFDTQSDYDLVESTEEENSDGNEESEEKGIEEFFLNESSLIMSRISTKTALAYRSNLYSTPFPDLQTPPPQFI